MSEFLQLLRRRAETAPASIVFEDEQGTLTAAGLLRRIGGLARRLDRGADVVGVLAPNANQWAVAALACKWAGRTVVPLPDFFSAGQLAHIVADAGVQAVVTTQALAPLARGLGLPSIVDGGAEASPGAAAEHWAMIVYSSGSTGQPKGVVLGDRQLDASGAMLAAAVRASPQDVYLSTLPLALLLEQISAIHLPIRAGARAIFSADLTRRALAGDGGALVDTVARVRPSVMSLVPQLLRAWVHAAGTCRAPPPETLRLVAVGGAPIPEVLARAAWSIGIPVHEGYGLSECCAVVSINRPGERRAGTVGRKLDGIAIEIVDGEIVVGGPTVMDGYLRGAAAEGRWPTGDIGAIDADGYLTVLGRKDAVIRTALGRNIHPEWIENLLCADPRVQRCVIAGDGCAWPVAIVELSPAGRAWRGQAWRDQAGGSTAALVAELAAAAPDYARPRHVVDLPPGALGEPSLLTGNGRPRRAAVAERFAEVIAALREGRNAPAATPIGRFETLLADTRIERERFLQIPVIGRAVTGGVDAALYLAFLGQAYHHVKHTCPLLTTAAARCGPGEEWLRDAFLHYVAEEQGHEQWILDDIAALGGDAAAVRDAAPRPPCAAMVEGAYRAIEERGPSALLGMVHVLEGMSVLLAERAAGAIRRVVPAGRDGAGFRYLTSHGALDIGHVAFFRTLVERMDDPAALDAVTTTANEMYRLYGDMFRELDSRGEEQHAA
ncbi:MAG: AMP-binding protein [Alphaproteobacteria bacterium]|nr:AMP-binding protein [Alphaproteobacteria bacterium]